MKRKSWRINIFVLLLLSLTCLGGVNAESEIHEVSNENEEKNKVDYNNQVSYSSGGSNWSRTKPTKEETDGYVGAKVYLPATSGSSWSAKSSQDTKTYCSEEEKDSCSVTKFDGTENVYKHIPKTCSSTSCSGGKEGQYKGCGGDACDSAVNVKSGMETGYCVPTSYPNGVSCTSGWDCRGSNEKKCYYYKCKFYETSYSDCSYDEFDYTKYKYSTSTQFAGGNGDNRSYGYTTQNSYTQEIYIYSYPKTINIEYDGNGANGVCNTGASGTNTFNINTGVKYEAGNPVCQTSKQINGKMSNTTIDYKSGVKRIRIHDLRHSYATNLINSGASIVAVSKSLGHSTITQTLDTYTHLLQKTDENMVKLLGSMQDNFDPFLK